MKVDLWKPPPRKDNAPGAGGAGETLREGHNNAKSTRPEKITQDALAAARQRGNQSRRRYQPPVKALQDAGTVGHKHYALMFGSEASCTSCGLPLPDRAPSPQLLCEQCLSWAQHRLAIRHAAEAFGRRK